MNIKSIDDSYLKINIIKSNNIKYQTHIILPINT